MKKAFFILSLLVCSSVFLQAQNFVLNINSTGIKADSIHFQVFDKKRDFKDSIVIPFSEKAVVKQKGIMPAGYYRVMADSNMLFELLISENKKQNLTVTTDADANVVFANSEENANCLAYNRQSEIYAGQRAALQKQFTDAQQTMPQYMLQTLAQNLMAQDAEIQREDSIYKEKVMAENPGTLLASIIRFSFELPQPPQHYYQNRGMLMHYYAEHAFDYFAFEDVRMITTPMAVYRLREFCGNLLYMQPTEGARLTDVLLTKAQTSPETYLFFFNWLEKTFGAIGTSYWNEEIYRTMLRNALDYKDLTSSKHNACQREYDLLNRNLEGTQIPDFHILWSDDTKTSLYDVESEYTLLYFQNPDCPTCTEVRGRLAVNEDLNKAIASGRLKVVTIYFEDDEALWRRYLAEKANPNYLHGWDYLNEINSKNLFDLRAIPYMFLLDKDKKVLKKDILENEISDYLHHYQLVE